MQQKFEEILRRKNHNFARLEMLTGFWKFQQPSPFNSNHVWTFNWALQLA